METISLLQGGKEKYWCNYKSCSKLSIFKVPFINVMLILPRSSNILLVDNAVGSLTACYCLTVPQVSQDAKSLG